MLYDTHCHPNLAKDKDKNIIIKNFLEENPKGFLNIIWTNPGTNSDILELVKNYDRVFCSVWIHPCDIYDLDLEKTILELENQIIKDRNSPIIPFHKGDENNKIVAIWECWLDYYWLKEKPLSWILSPSQEKEATNKYKKEDIEKIVNLKKNLQKIFFKAQIKLAEKYNLPIIIHNRESKDDILEILEETWFKNFIFHCYSENLEYAKKLLKLSPNCKISFSWIVTFKNAKYIQETAKSIPLKNILIETDSPYLTPTPFRWKEENEPSFIKYILEKIIELRDEDPEEIRKVIFENSKKVFNIK